MMAWHLAGRHFDGFLREMHHFTSNYYHFLDPPNLQILWEKFGFGNPGADRILAAPGFANLEGPNWEILRILPIFGLPNFPIRILSILW